MDIKLRDDGSYYKTLKDKVHSISYNKGVQVNVFAVELMRLARLVGLNGPGMFAQAWHETGGFGSDKWKKQKNPAGIKRGDGVGYQTYVNGVDAARAMVVHMAAYVPPRNIAILDNYLYLDGRYEMAKRINQGMQYSTFDDLTGRWAIDPEYGKLVTKVYHELYG